MNEKNLKRILLAAGIIFSVIFCLAPFIWMLIISFSRHPDFLSKGINELTLKNYHDILSISSLYFTDYLTNSLIISLTASFSSCIIAGLSAYAVSRMNFPGRIIIVLTILAISMFPQISIVGFLHKLMTFLGWINSYQGLVLPYIAWSLPLALWMLFTYFSAIPVEIDKAGLIDGAGHLQIFLKIILPVSIPGLLSTFLLLFVFTFNEFLFALLLTTDYETRTVPVGLTFFQGLHGEIPWGYIMASSVISCIPVIVIALVFQRFIIQGLTGGAVKK